eukprot:691286-Prorocentrum_minimum.AAC.2
MATRIRRPEHVGQRAHEAVSGGGDGVGGGGVGPQGGPRHARHHRQTVNLRDRDLALARRRLRAVRLRLHDGQEPGRVAAGGEREPGPETEDPGQAAGMQPHAGRNGGAGARCARAGQRGRGQRRGRGQGRGRTRHLRLSRVAAGS